MILTHTSVRNFLAVSLAHSRANSEDSLETFSILRFFLKKSNVSLLFLTLFHREYQDDRKKLFVVMEKGDTDLAALFKNARKLGTITESMRKFYWEEMLQAVRVLHREGIIHSDLKPANFLLVAGHLKLIDFGIAKAIQPEHTSAIRDQQVKVPRNVVANSFLSFFLSFSFLRHLLVCFESEHF